MKYQDWDKFTLINNEARLGRDRVRTGSGLGLDLVLSPLIGGITQNKAVIYTMNKCFLIVSFDHQLINVLRKALYFYHLK